MQQETTGDSSTYAPLVPVPPERRAFGTRDAFALWFSLGIGLLVAQAGALLVPGLSLPHALAAIVIGTVIGALIIAVIQYGLVFVNVEPFWQFVAVGVVIVISVLVDQSQRRLGGGKVDEE